MPFNHNKHGGFGPCLGLSQEVGVAIVPSYRSQGGGCGLFAHHYKGGGFAHCFCTCISLSKKVGVAS